MPSVQVSSGGRWRKANGKIGEGVRILAGDLLSLALQALQFLELFNADRSGDIRHVVFITRSYDFVIPAWYCGLVAIENIAVDAVQAHGSRSPRELLVVRNQHASFARAQSLGGIEAEYSGGPESARRTAVP